MIEFVLLAVSLSKCKRCGIGKVHRLLSDRTEYLSREDVDKLIN
jgi:hypothetical protein